MVMKKKLRDILNLINESIDSESVLDAIHNKYQVRIRYDDGMEDNGGNSKGSRVIKPYAIGTTKKGYPVVRAFQEGGGSRRGAPKWKFFRLDRITSWIPMRNKKFFDTPPESFGRYNPNGDKTMGHFVDNAKFNDFISPLEKQRMQYQNDVKVGQQRNQQGPVNQPRISQQWKKNVYTSQPNSKKYDMIRKNIDNTEKKGDDFWRLFDLNDAENTMTQQKNQQGPVNNNSYDINDVDFDENEYFNNNRR
jgi:hypothetical protein